jgi:hypothetical protein
LGEPRLPDGSPVLRPCVFVAPPGTDDALIAVVDSGAPITVAAPTLLAALGVDIAVASPIMEVPLGIAGASGRVAIFEVELDLVPPPDLAMGPRRWRLHMAAHPRWRLPFAVLLGYRGWFDQFRTTIDASTTTVHLEQGPAARRGGRGFRPDS